mgnify:CR=1 FL=1
MVYCEQHTEHAVVEPLGDPRHRTERLIEVAGHTDSTGSEDYNQRLSERRAQSVVDYFKSRKIIDARLLTVGMGELRPVADNGTPEGRQLNRRVEITLVPHTA